MGFLSKIFKKDERKSNALVEKNTRLTMPIPNNLPIHPDITNLLWVTDGARKNYNPNKNQNTFEINGLRIVFSFIDQEEPSLIYIKQPIVNVSDISRVERPPYYPTYSGLTPEQKGVYWNLLANFHLHILPRSTDTANMAVLCRRSILCNWSNFANAFDSKFRNPVE